MKITLIAEIDKKGSEATEYFHYTYGRPGDSINGGVYIDKKTEHLPDFIEIKIKKEV